MRILAHIAFATIINTLYIWRASTHADR